VAANLNYLTIRRHILTKGSVHGIVFQQVGVHCRIAQIVNGYDFEIRFTLALKPGPQDVSSYAAKAIDGYLHHLLPIVHYKTATMLHFLSKIAI